MNSDCGKIYYFNECDKLEDKLQSYIYLADDCIKSHVKPNDRVSSDCGKRYYFNECDNLEDKLQSYIYLADDYLALK